MEKRSWVLTVITQLSLCFGLYLALNLGQPQLQQKPHSVRSRITTTNTNTANANGNNNNNNNNTPLDLYFISVQGEGTTLRPPSQQTRLLNMMGKVMKAYDPRFVLNIAELGENDPLLKNDTRNFQSLTVPWYTTTASKGKPVDFVKRIELPVGKTLDIIAINTGILQDSSNMTRSHQLQQQLAKILEAADSHWRIVIGLHQFDSCKRSSEQLNMKQIYVPLHKTFLKYGVNAYLSRRGCTGYALRNGIAYIGLPGPMGKGHRHMLGNGRLAMNESSGEGDDGFLLHRINSLEMETYFVTLSGKVSHKVASRQRGAGAV